MLLKKIGAKNYFIALLFLLIVTIVLVVLGFVLTALIPDAPGRNPYSYQIDSANLFEPWVFEIENLSVTYPEGGIILNLDRTNQYRSDLLLGDALISIDGNEISAEEIGGLFITLEYEHFEEIRGNNIFEPLEDEIIRNQLESIAEKQIGIPPIWKEKIPLIFHRQDGLTYYYFIAPDGDPILPPAGNYSMTTLLGSFLLYILFVFITLLAITIFSPDHRYSRYWMHLGKTPPGATALVLVPLIAGIALAGEIVPDLFDWPGYFAFVGYAAAAALLIALAQKGKLDYLDLGLRRDRIKNGYLLAIITALLIIGATRGMPDGFAIEGLSCILKLPLLFALLGLPREMIWRGYIQAVLSRQLGATRGLIAMIILVALTHYIGIMATEPWMALYPYTYLEVLVLAPGIAAILGYLYLRTENIIACALLHSLIIWLPDIIIY